MMKDMFGIKETYTFPSKKKFSKFDKLGSKKY